MAQRRLTPLGGRPRLRATRATGSPRWSRSCRPSCAKAALGTRGRSATSSSRSTPRASARTGEFEADLDALIGLARERAAARPGAPVLVAGDPERAAAERPDAARHPAHRAASSRTSAPSPRRPASRSCSTPHDRASRAGYGSAVVAASAARSAARAVPAARQARGPARPARPRHGRLRRRDRALLPRPFAREGIDPREIRGAADLARLPLLDRELVRASPELFRRRDARRPRRALPFTTSGSTGDAAARASTTGARVLANIAFGERERAPDHRRHRRRASGRRSSTSATRRRRSSDVTAFYAENTLLPVRPRRRVRRRCSSRSRGRRARERRAARTARRATAAGSTSSSRRSRRAASSSTRRSWSCTWPRRCRPAGASSSRAPSASRCCRATARPRRSRSASTARSARAFTCTRTSATSASSDRRTRRRRASSGRIVISNLVNRGSVLLNYPIGDVGSITEEPCPCGRTFRLLSELEGRVEDILPLADGRFVHPRAVWQVFKDDPDVLQYQLTQHEPDRFELTLATLDDEAFARAWGGRSRRCGSCSARRAIDVPAARGGPARRGKFRAVVSRCLSRLNAVVGDRGLRWHRRAGSLRPALSAPRRPASPSASTRPRTASDREPTRPHRSSCGHRARGTRRTDPALAGLEAPSTAGRRGDGSIRRARPVRHVRAPRSSICSSTPGRPGRGPRGAASRCRRPSAR